MSKPSNRGNLGKENGPQSGNVGTRFVNVEFRSDTKELKVEVLLVSCFYTLEQRFEKRC